MDGPNNPLTSLRRLVFWSEFRKKEHNTLASLHLMRPGPTPVGGAVEV